VRPSDETARTPLTPEDPIATPVCPTCGRCAEPDDRFCGRCGKPIALVCARCGRAHPADLSFCTGCGHPLREARLGAIEERRRVSILFIDAVESTPFVERSDPETVRARQSDFFATVQRVVRQYGGIVEKYIGDAAMALFGAPVATETDAVRCVRAGLDLQRALARQADQSAGWSFRAGVATGEALVDVAVAHDGGQGIAAGDVVNTANRLQSQAPRGGVLVCGSTHAATRSEIRYAARSPVVLRGHSAPTEVWLALAPVQPQIEREPDEGDPVGGDLVGRDHELGLLTTALHHVIEERTPQLVSVLGQAGIGKSRLVRELYRYAARLDVPVCWRGGRCPPFGENVAYAALADIVRAQAGVRATDDPETTRTRLDATVRDLIPVRESARLAEALRPLLGLTGAPLSNEDAESAWRLFVLGLASRGPTVLVFEDLHWADDRMPRFIELLAGTIRDVPLLLIVTARPELVDREPAWSGGVPGMLAISLTPLRDDTIASLYAQALGPATLSPDQMGRLVELADGMPLYAREYGRMLVDRGILRPSDGAWVMDPLREAGGDLPMPDTVHAVIANRIDLLDPAERAVLQVAAVVGPRFWPGALAAALGTGVDAVDRALRGLAQRDLIREQPDSSMATEPEYRFRHGLVSDVCYERLPRAERIGRHVRTADWLEAQVGHRGTEVAEVVAHHRFVAFDTARGLGLDTTPYVAPALAALSHAARRAVMLDALDVAAAHVARANQVVAGGAGEPDRLGVELLTLELALARDPDAFVAGPGPERLAELATSLHRAGDHGGAARAWTLRGQVAWRRADRGAALRCLDRAVELFDSWPDTSEKAQAYAELGRLHLANLEHSPAIGATRIAAEIAERLGLVELRANAVITIGLSRFHAGEPDALADLEEAQRFCRTHHLPSLRRATEALAVAARELGDRYSGNGYAAPPVDAVQPFDAAAPLDGGPDAPRRAAEPGTDAVTALSAGDFDRFDAAARAVLAGPAAADDLIRVRAARAWLRALRAESAGAVEDAAAALSAARATGLWRPLWTAMAHVALADAILAHLGPTADTGPGLRRDAVDLLRELGTRWKGLRTIAGVDWVGAAAHAAVLIDAGPGPSRARAAAELRDAIMQTPKNTPWSRAALASLDGALASAWGDHAAAAQWHLDAAQRYATLGGITDRAFALAAACRALAAAGDPQHRQVAAEVADVAVRNHAPGLTQLTHLPR
jgi:class 3 adenylate cyclase